MSSSGALIYGAKMSTRTLLTTRTTTEFVISVLRPSQQATAFPKFFFIQVRVRSEFSFYREELPESTRVLFKSDDIQWMELDFCPEPDNAINYILQQRIKFGWNIKLPVNGANIRHWMDHYQDRVDTNLKRTLDDNGEFHYCLCVSDIRENILYAPYELRITSVDEAKKYPVYYTVSSSYVTKVSCFCFLV